VALLSVVDIPEAGRLREGYSRRGLALLSKAVTFGTGIVGAKQEELVLLRLTQLDGPTGAQMTWFGVIAGVGGGNVRPTKIIKGRLDLYGSYRNSYF
jgi:hypothetical protein